MQGTVQLMLQLDETHALNELSELPFVESRPRSSTREWTVVFVSPRYLEIYPNTWSTATKPMEARSCVFKKRFPGVGKGSGRKGRETRRETHKKPQQRN